MDEYQAAMASIMALLDVDTPEAALATVQRMVNDAPAIGIDVDGRLHARAGMTVGAALQLLETARTNLLNARVA